MRLPSLALLLVAAALPGCAGPTSYRSAFAFRCGSVGHYGLGTLMVARWIRHDRTLAATVLRWLPRMPEDSLIHMEVQWAARPPKDIDLDRGILTITQRVTGGDFVLGSSRSYIELSKTPAGDGSKAAFKGWIEPRKSMDAIHLTADWSGVRQFAGRNDLYLVVHDSRGKIVNSTPLPNVLFWEAPSRRETLREAQSGPGPDILLDNGCETDSSPAQR
jgi:hypothetical protein